MSRVSRRGRTAKGWWQDPQRQRDNDVIGAAASAIPSSGEARPDHTLLPGDGLPVLCRHCRTGVWVGNARGFCRGCEEVFNNQEGWVA